MRVNIKIAERVSAIVAPLHDTGERQAPPPICTPIHKGPHCSTHRRIHTGRRPYKCRHEGCNKSFARKTVLTKHQKMAHDSSSNKRKRTLQWRPVEVAVLEEKHRQSSSSESSSSVCSPSTPTLSWSQPSSPSIADLQPQPPMPQPPCFATANAPIILPFPSSHRRESFLHLFS